MKSARANIVIRVIAGVLAVAAVGCPAGKKEAPNADGTGKPSGPSKVTLNLNWVPEPEFGGFYAAKDTGSFKRHELDVEIRGGGAGVPVVQMVASGQIEFGIAGADEILTARARGADVVPLFATYQTSPQGIMVHKSRGAKNIQEVFAQGTLAMEPGVSYAAFLKKKFGEPKATIVPYDGGSARFLTDKTMAQQCYVTAEPLLAKRKGADPQVLLIADEGYNPYVGVLITRKKIWDEKPAMVRAFVAAAREGWRAYLTDPKPANAIMAKLNTSMDAQTFQEAADAQKALIEAEPLGKMTKERWDTLSKQLTDIAVLKGAAPTDFLVDL